MWWVVQFFRYALLVVIILMASLFWAQERALAGIARRPGVFAGKAMGAGAMVRGLAKLSQWISGKIRSSLGRYVRAQHPRVYRRLQVLFR